MLAWIGVSNVSAQLSNADELTAIIGSTPVTTMTTGTYYVLQNSSTGEYLVDNNGTYATNITAPVNGDADSEGIFNYMFTRTSAGYIQSAAGNNLPELQAGININEVTVGQGGQLAPRKNPSAGVYTVSVGTSSTYVYLSNNSLFLNCDLLGATVQGSYSDWKMLPVTLINRGESTICNLTYIYKNGDTEWYREIKTVVVGDSYPDLYPQPLGVKYTNVPYGDITGSEEVIINCELTDECPVKIFSADFSSAKWLFLSINSTNYHLRYVANQNYITVNTSQTTRPATTSDYGYQWAFVGNPLIGFMLMNRLAGDGKILVSAAPSSTNSGGDTYPFMTNESGVNTNTYNKTWQLTEIYNGFMLSRPGEGTYINNRGGKMSYWTSYDYGSVITAAPVDMSMTAPTLDTSKTYMLVNKLTGKALADKEVDGSHVAYPIDPDAADHYCIWTATKSGNYYYFKNYGNSTNYYIGKTTPSGDPNAYIPLVTSASSGTYYVREAADDGYYYLLTSTSTASGTKDRVALADNNGQYTTYGGAFGSAMEWELREVTPETPRTNASSITSGNYYRLINRNYTDYAMSEAGGKVAATAINREAYNQVWKITQSGSGYSLQNALTGKYIQMNPGTSTQFSTGTTSRAFTSHTTTSNDTTFFAFDSGNNGYNSLHCASSYNVVGWTYDADASYWILENVTLSDDDLANIEATRDIANGSGTNYTTQLTTFFSDYACTTLKSTYASMTDTELRSAMSSLPTELQDMAVRVKNDTWNSDATFNRYEKDFRIHSYEIYSDCDAWYSITKVGPFAHLFNPTGIQAKAGDIIYLFVDTNKKDSYATLQAELVTGTNRTGTTTTLSRGYNAIYVNDDCELFITYLLTNTSKSCNDYPSIKIHIEGATCNGCFDMHRGHTNNDWMWLKSNMFKNKYLHVKGESTLLNVLLDEVKAENNATGVMKIWDFVFDTEESLSGCDQWKTSGRYKMMINNFRNETDYPYPHWGSGHGTSHPTLNSSYLFNYNGLANIGVNGGHLWEITHEIGHGHQTPIKTVGTTEASNNTLSQICNYYANGNELFQSARSSRGVGVANMLEKFNSGYSWIDISGQRGGDSDLWLSNRWLYQLWMYFDLQKNYKPDTNNGFAFMSDLYDAMRSDPITYGTTTSNPGTAANDYLKMAKYAAQLTETDLSEFFQGWGFWELTPTISNDNDVTASNIWYYNDYTTYYLQTSQTSVNTVRSAMQAYEKKSNIIFMEDRAVGSTLPTYNDAATSTFGETGYYETYTDKVTKAYDYTLSDTTVTMTEGEGAVGFKIYDSDGNLVYLANTNSFTVSSDIATGLNNGTYYIVAAQGDGTDYRMGECMEYDTIGELAKLIQKALNGQATWSQIDAKVQKVLEHQF